MSLHNRMSTLVACLLVAGVLAASAAGAAPAAHGGCTPSKPTKASGAEVKAATGVITELYNAYVARDVDKVMALERLSFEAAAEAYEKQGKGKASDVIDAYRGATDEVLKHKDFAMKPLNLADAQFQRVGDSVVVSSVIPIIATELVEVGEPGSGNKVRLRIGKFVFRAVDGTWQIVRMDFF